MENPFEQLNQKLESIENKIERLIQTIDNPQDKISKSPTWITSKQLANHLGLSVTAITNLRGSKIPYYKIGGRILFKKQEVDEFIEKTRHKTGGEYLNEYLNSDAGKERVSKAKY